MGLEGYKITGKAREEFLKKSQRIAAEQMEMQELYKYYNEYIEYGGMQPESGYRFKENFLKLINYINKQIYDLKKEGKLSEFVQIRSRIKGVQSAIKNHISERQSFEEKITRKLENDEEKDIKGKTLDDIFGIEIVCATEEEISLLKEELEKFLSKTKPTRKHDKDNGYKAEHDSYCIKEDIILQNEEKVRAEGTPVIECQTKTIAVLAKCQYGGEASHVTYKGEDTKRVQEMYDRGEFILGYNLPIMYESDYDEKKNPIMRKLTLEETLRKEYPFLDMSQKNKARD